MRRSKWYSSDNAFAMYQQGNGIRTIAATLNAKGLRYRRGGNFNSSHIHQILTRSAYRGVHHFNKKCCKTKQPKDPSEWVSFETPVIIDEKIYEDVQARLAARRPTNTPPRIVNGPTLLTGIAKCGTCGGGMTLRTGKGGRYRYYTCNTRVTQGKTACEGRNIPMQKLDTLVIEQLEEHLFHEDRMTAMHFISVLSDRKQKLSLMRRCSPEKRLHVSFSLYSRITNRKFA